MKCNAGPAHISTTITKREARVHQNDPVFTCTTIGDQLIGVPYLRNCLEGTGVGWAPRSQCVCPTQNSRITDVRGAGSMRLVRQRSLSNAAKTSRS